jgi:hypothetical protein
MKIRVSFWTKIGKEEVEMVSIYDSPIVPLKVGDKFWFSIDDPYPVTVNKKKSQWSEDWVKKWVTDIREKQVVLRSRYKIKRVYNSITEDHNFSDENGVRLVVEYHCVKSNPIYWKFWQTYKFKSFFKKLFKNK